MYTDHTTVYTTHYTDTDTVLTLYMLVTAANQILLPGSCKYNVQ